jgi:flagellar biogenesis protein FliO
MNSYLQDIFYTLAALTVVVAMIWLLVKSLKGIYRSHGRDNPIQLTRTMPVGSRERLIVVTYRDCEYLVGITAGGMSLIDKLPIPKDCESPVNGSKDSDGAAAGSADTMTSGIHPTDE